MDWIAGLGDVAPATRAALAALPARSLPKGMDLFSPGDRAQGYPVVLAGRVEVYLTGPNGREIMLYGVEPGQSCVQTTLGLLGDEPYSGAAVTVTDCETVVIPKPLFLRLMDADAGFRLFVLRSFGQRMADLTRLLEAVAFGRVEARLASVLLDLADGHVVRATQSEIAARIGSAREVVSRKLDAFAKSGWVTTERGEVHLRDPAALRRASAAT
ncbi:Crp/Fnr family transcriptional regulator [Gemmobacter aquarius]|uniref:Crp/Fnr family transcriptional regulator n=1 Tax=Paragemmobacter aquarius TaxID=2169400 RepID=A0A2S0UKY8_9RHOB|nr:Crp/Fnr family transcriptional regulator [Gemmobacter aquarius]AWB48430.1 Crp/Fnr family transcriptional regulator [Gemmobacter aquarius]